MIDNQRGLGKAFEERKPGKVCVCSYKLQCFCFAQVYTCTFELRFSQNFNYIINLCLEYRHMNITKILKILIFDQILMNHICKLFLLHNLLGKHTLIKHQPIKTNFIDASFQYIFIGNISLANFGTFFPQSSLNLTSN